MKNDLTGRKFGRLVVIGLHGTDKHGKRLWDCQCECGNMSVVSTHNLKSSNTKSCGCLSRETTTKRNTTHGLRNARLYQIWALMKNRCADKNNPCYKNYGGRGITVCDQWKYSFEDFYNWAMANGYDDTLSLDRIDNNGNYEPGNCRWVTVKEQSYNRRTNRYIEIDGEMKTVTEWARLLNCSRRTVIRRFGNGEKITI